MNEIDLKIFWNQLAGIANEQGRALRHIAFRPSCVKLVISAFSLRSFGPATCQR